MDQNRKFAEMNGLCWHKFDHTQYSPKEQLRCIHCRKYGWEIKDNPDFSDQREVLKVVMEKEDWPEFHTTLFKITGYGWASSLIPIDYITTPGKLRDAWIEWMRSRGIAQAALKQTKPESKLDFLPYTTACDCVSCKNEQTEGGEVDENI
jgi:hypothetical protein